MEDLGELPVTVKSDEESAKKAGDKMAEAFLGKAQTLVRDIGTSLGGARVGAAAATGFGAATAGAGARAGGMRGLAGGAARLLAANPLTAIIGAAVTALGALAAASIQAAKGLEATVAAVSPEVIRARAQSMVRSLQRNMGTAAVLGGSLASFRGAMDDLKDATREVANLFGRFLVPIATALVKAFALLIKGIVRIPQLILSIRRAYVSVAETIVTKLRDLVSEQGGFGSGPVASGLDLLLRFLGFTKDALDEVTDELRKMRGQQQQGTINALMLSEVDAITQQTYWGPPSVQRADLPVRNNVP